MEADATLKIYWLQCISFFQDCLGLQQGEHLVETITTQLSSAFLVGETVRLHGCTRKFSVLEETV